MNAQAIPNELSYYGKKSMKSGFTLVLALVASMIGSLGAAPNAYASMVNHSGTICKNYYAWDAAKIDYYINGAKSAKTSQTYVICPLTRNTTHKKGAYVYVDFTHNGKQSTRCTAYSYNYRGSLLKTASDSWTGSGFHRFSLNLRGTNNSNTWSDYVVLCSIPGNRKGIIHGVGLSDY